MSLFNLACAAIIISLLLHLSDSSTQLLMIGVRMSSFMVFHIFRNPRLGPCRSWLTTSTLTALLHVRQASPLTILHICLRSILVRVSFLFFSWEFHSVCIETLQASAQRSIFIPVPTANLSNETLNNDEKGNEGVETKRSISSISFSVSCTRALWYMQN